jgi:protein tyrosine/serine phosphatase
MNGRDPTLAPLTPPASLSRRLLLLRAILGGGLSGLLFAVGVEFANIAFGGNVHEVIPGAIYRCSHPTPDRLSTLVHRYGIRTVVNLQGCSVPAGWYLEESRATAQLDLSQEDLPFSAARLPSVPVIRELVDVLDHSERPLLIHCHQGIDRTGMASAMAILLYTDSSLETALHQLGPRYGHLPLGHNANIDRFFELYAEWLRDKGCTHSSAVFRHWVEKEYCPGECLAFIEILEPRDVPLVMQHGEPLAVRVRCKNVSVKPWRFRPGTNAGIHVFWRVLTVKHEYLVKEGRSGLFHTEVAPGEAIELTLALPSIDKPGRYLFRIDMADEQHAHFHQLGPEPLDVELEVR